MHTIDTIVSP